MVQAPQQQQNTAQAAWAAYRNQRFFGSLNGLRFLCIIAVMWHHSPLRAARDSTSLLWDRGYLGVDFFFVLSGFLITTLLLREEERNGQFSLRGFYWRRILRIVPVYYLVVTAVGVYYIFVKGQSQFLDIWLYYYLFLSNFLTTDIPLLTITWSLAVEEQYYMIWPLLLLLLPVRGLARPGVLIALIVLCVLSAAGYLAFTGLSAPETAYALWRLPVGSYAAILLGTLSAVLLHRPESYAAAWRLMGHPAAPLVTFGGLLALLIVWPGVLVGGAALLVHLCMTLCLISIVLREQHVLARPLAWSPVARIGEISYGLYLYHMIGRHIGVEAGAALGLGPWGTTVLFVVVSVLIAEVSFRTLEAWFLGLKHRKPVPLAQRE